MKKLILTAASTGILLLAACSHDSKDFKENAEAFIQSDNIESQLATTFTGAVCTEPAKVATDETFTCSAVDAEGETWNFSLVITSKDSYEVTGALPQNPEAFIQSIVVETEAGTTFTGATCTEPATQDVGATFTCTAAGGDGATWDFNMVVVAADGEYELSGGAPRG